MMNIRKSKQQNVCDTIITKEETLAYVDKAKKKLGPAYSDVRKSVEEDNKEYGWRAVKVAGARSTKFECTKCGHVTPVARRYCPECGVRMFDDCGNIIKSK